MADDLCLFSFEIFIERINYLKIHCIEPAVAFRLLDYPTIIIYKSFPEASASELLANSISPNQKEENNLSNFIFDKGKSCLFKIGYQEFESMLHKAPLYVMILDCVDEKPKLLGTCSIPLLSLLSQITNDAENHKYESPSYGTEKNTYNIFNLMSTHIGSVTLNLKLTCFGKSLLKHITVNNKKESKIDVLLDLKKTKEVKGEVEHVLVPPTGVEYKIDNNKDAKSYSVKDKSIQCKRTSKHQKKNNYEKQQNKKESVDENSYNNNSVTVETENIIYPPLLYMNLDLSEAKKTVKTVNNNDKSDIKERMKYLLETKYSDYESLSSDEEPYIEVIQPNQQKYHYSKTKRTEPINQSNKDVVTQTDVVQPLVSSTNSNIINAPILNSLLQEIVSILSLNQKPSTCGGECQKIKSLEDTSNNMDKNDIKSLDTGNSKHQIKLEKENIAKSNLNNKNQKFPLRKGLNKKTKKLKYGPTRTQKLRYLITHPKEENVVHKPHLNIEDEAKRNPHQSKDSAMPIDYFKDSVDVAKINKSDDSFYVSKINDVENDNEAVLSEEKHNVCYSSLSFTIPTPEVDYSSHDSDNELSKEAANNGTEVGFYSPKEQLKITPTALGEFDDEQPWSSEHIYDETFEKDEDSKSNKSTISETSSISLPNASERTISSNEGENVKASSLGRSKSSLRLHSSRQLKHSMSNKTNSKQSVSKLSMYSNNTNKISIESLNDNDPWKTSRSKSNVSLRSSRLSLYSPNDTNISFQENEPVKSKYSPVKSKQFSKKQLSREISMSYGTPTSFNSVQS